MPRNSHQPAMAWASGLCLLVAMAWWALPIPLLPLAIGLAPLIVVQVLRQPFVVCLWFIIFSFFRIHEAFPQLYNLRIPQLLAVASLGVIAWELVLSKKLEVFWSRELTPFAIFFCLVSLGVTIASNPATAINTYTGSYCKIGLMVLVISWLVRTEGELASAARYFVLAGISVGLVALYNKSNGIGLVEGTRVTIGRDLDSMLGDPNDLSLVLTFPASFALGLALRPQAGRLDRVLGVVGFCVVASAIIATQSRGGLLGILAVMGVFAWRWVANKFLLCTGGGLAVAVLYAAAGISDRASGGASEEGLGESAMGRIYAWTAAWNMAKAHPLFGVGLSNFLPNYYLYTPHWDGMNHAVHSTWFGVLAETGFPGLIAFISMLAVAVLSCLRTLKTLHAHRHQGALHTVAESVLAGYAGFAISATFLTQGFIWPAYILLSLCVACGRQTRLLYGDDRQHLSPCWPWSSTPASEPGAKPAEEPQTPSGAYRHDH